MTDYVPLDWVDNATPVNAANLGFAARVRGEKDVSIVTEI